MGFVLALVAVIIVFLAIVGAIVFTEKLNEIVLLLLGLAILIGGIGMVSGWIKRP